MLQGGQFQTVQVPKRIQLVATPGNRAGNFNIDSQLVNCYAEFDPTTEDYWIEKRPGYGATIQSPAASGLSQGRGLYKFETSAVSGSFLAVNNNRVSVMTLAPGAPIIIGNVATGQNTFTFETIRSATPVVVMNDGANNYYTDGATVTDMATLANFPASTVKGWAYLDGTLYVMTQTNQIFGSANLDDATVWSALNVIVAREGSGWAVALAKHKSYVVALKTTSTEFFYNNANPSGSPLALLRGAQLPYGCAFADSVADVDSELFWFATSIYGGYHVVRLTNLKATVVSTPAVERLLRSIAGITSTTIITASALKIGGHRFYCMSVQVQAAGTRTSLLYDLDQNLWYRWTAASSNTEAWTVCMQAGADLSGRQLGQLYADATVHEISEDFNFVSDNGTVPLVQIVTPDHDFGTQRSKNLGAMYFRGNKTAGSKLQMRWSDDDEGTWSNFREIDLGTTRPAVSDCGSFYRRTWDFRHQSPTAFRMRTMDLQLDIGQL